MELKNKPVVDMILGFVADWYPQQKISDQTTSRGDGFWKGCCAAICCCCALDICF
ncbi:putative cysteine-rich transmembrane CYSTM domain-containing protein [Medicago truncatula]|uniref:Putative cysteine-rich transmembrane CYSTM domain-containing protein n=1 Tax=Medicago truncatula TaxID=3880 RepID=A0A396J8L1_MEDTR|nr:putative cysteine-rich transmembrane CYSTM domain-containing protein [Medicago truncatula]